MNLLKSIIAIAMLLTVIGVSAQSNTPKKFKPLAIPNTVVVKLLPSTIGLVQGARVASPIFSKIFESVEITSFKQLWPKANKTNCLSKNINKPNNVDLSGIYILKYSGKKDIEEIIFQLKKSGLVVYAEPQFVDYALFTPNDPEAQPNAGKQYQLAAIKAYEAWNIEKGDSNMVVGIVDTDQNIFHPDLVGRTKVNTLDPINGKDDDDDGFVDNYRGWDVANDDNDVTQKKVVVDNAAKTGKDTLNGNGHGTRVFGFAGATVNNGIGIAGISFNNKILPVKAMDDIDATKGFITAGYPGIIYAAEHGAKVINCSWGSFGSYAQLAQDAINYATFNFDALVIAAAGNENVDKMFYPASYDNVLCVAASEVTGNNIDIKAPWATYSHQVDISSPGVNMYSTFKDGYAQDNGSSYAAPTVAGAAGLVRAHFPKYTALQTLEQLRMTADNMDAIPENAAYKEKLGKGRLNILRALTETTSPAVKMFKNNMPDNLTTIVYSGETVKLVAHFRNYLASTSNLKITLRALSPFIEMKDSIISLGQIGTLDSATHTSKPFIFKIKNNIPVNQSIEFRLSFTDGKYNDYQYFWATFNPDFVTLDTNQIKVTIASNGRIGYNDASSSQGFGLVYKTRNLLFESGLVISAPNNKISDCVRSSPINFNAQSFVPTKTVNYNTSAFAGQETTSEFVDTSANKVGVKVIQNSYASPTAPNDKFAIVRYYITNTSNMAVDSMRVGLYTDWDIMISNRNRADFDVTTNLAFCYSSQTNGIYAGAALLSRQPLSGFSFDHSSAIKGNNINPNDGFTNAEKNQSLSNGILRAKAGTSGLGGDVSQMIGGVLLNMQANETRQIAFALIAGDNKTDLLNSAKAAKILYEASIKPLSIYDENAVSEIVIFPNPTKDILYVSGVKFETASTVTIENMMGITVWSGEIDIAENTINTGQLTKGVYILKIKVGDKIVVKKFLKD